MMPPVPSSDGEDIINNCSTIEVLYTFHTCYLHCFIQDIIHRIAVFTCLHNAHALRWEGIGRFYLMITSTACYKVKEASIVNILMFHLCIYSPGFIVIILLNLNF